MSGLRTGTWKTKRAALDVGTSACKPPPRLPHGRSHGLRGSYTIKSNAIGYCAYNTSATSTYNRQFFGPVSSPAFVRGNRKTRVQPTNSATTVAAAATNLRNGTRMSPLQPGPGARDIKWCWRFLRPSIPSSPVCTSAEATMTEASLEIPGKVFARIRWRRRRGVVEVRGGGGGGV